MKKNGQFLKKTIASLLTFIFLSTQAVWAMDVRQLLLDAKAGFDLEDEQARAGVGPGELVKAESNQQAAVDQQQALQDLQQLNSILLRDQACQHLR